MCSGSRFLEKVLLGEGLSFCYRDGCGCYICFGSCVSFISVSDV